MANYGPNTNASQFIFSLRTNAAFNGLFVGVGEILEGFHLFDDLEAIAQKDLREQSTQVPEKEARITYTRVEDSNIFVDRVYKEAEKIPEFGDDEFYLF